MKKLIFGIFLGVACALFFVEHDPWVSNRIASTCKNFFSKTYDCSLSTDQDIVSLCRPSLTCTNVVLKPYKSSLWQWKAKRLTIGFSWWQFFLYGVVNFYIHIQGMEVEISSPEGFYEYKQHIASMMNAGNTIILCRLDELLFEKTKCHYTDTLQQIEITMNGQAAMRRADGSIRSLITLEDGLFCKDQKPVIEKVHGSVQLGTGCDMQAATCEADGQFSCVISHLPSGNNSCFARGSWRHGSGRCMVTNKDHTCSIDPVCITKTANGFEMKAHMKTRFAEAAALMGFKKINFLDGVIGADVAVNLYDDMHYDTKIDLLATCNGVAAVPVTFSCQSSFSSLDECIQGAVSLAHQDVKQLQGSWNYNKKTEVGNMQMKNILAHPLPTCPAWVVAPESCSLAMSCDAFSTITGNYTCSAVNKYKKNSISTAGTFTGNGTHMACKGVCGTMSYDADMLLDPYVKLVSAQVVNADKQPIISVETVKNSQKPLHATVEVSCLRSLCDLLYEYNLQAAGKLIIDAECHDSVIKADIRFADGSFCIPHIYNVVNGMKAQLVYDKKAQALTVANLVCSLHKGSLSVDHAVFMHDTAGTFVYWYLPVMIKNGLITSKQNFFAHVSGYLVASYIFSGLPHVKADLLLERSYIKENIFSDTFQKRLAKLAETSLLPTGPDATCDITIETVAPIKVQTPFLEADARMFLKIQNSARNPQIVGELRLLSGSLLFPYRPLLITKGIMSMTADQPYDPLIELVAQNQVRNHTVTMHVTGSLLQHHFMFESIPALTEEQIIALLLVGSQEESLNIVMPTLIMQNLASLVFGTTRSSSMLDRVFKRFIQPFKGIHIVPRFADQSSRGGLRGAIDIEVNDRWRAMIQKNFNLTEDTRFELEYQATDDVSLRAIRDEHRDMGAEVEMRWKF